LNFTSNPSWNIGVVKSLKLRITRGSNSTKYTLYLSNSTYDYKFSTIRGDLAWTSGDYGITTDTKGALFDSFFVRTPTNVQMSLDSCGYTDDQIRTIVYNALYRIILGFQASSVGTIYRYGCSKKRGAEETVIATIQGTNTANSETISYQLQTSYSHVASNEPVPSEITSVQSSSLPTSTDLVGVSVVEFLAPIVSALSVAALAGIIAGSVVGAAAITTGIVIGVKKLKKRKNDKVIPLQTLPEVQTTIPITDNNPPPPPKEETKYKPKGATVNIFELNPDDPQSITARSPALKNPNAQN